MEFFTFIIILTFIFILRNQIKSVTELIQQELDLYALSQQERKVKEIHKILNNLNELENKDGIDLISVQQSWEILKMKNEVTSLKLSKQQEEAIKELQKKGFETINCGLKKNYFK